MKPVKVLFKSLLPADQKKVRSIASNLLTSKILNKEVDPSDDTAMEIALEKCFLDAIKTLQAVDELLCG